MHAHGAQQDTGHASELSQAWVSWARDAALWLTGDGVGAVEGELHVVLRGDAEDGLNVPHKLHVAIGAALHAHVVHLPHAGPSLRP